MEDNKNLAKNYDPKDFLKKDYMNGGKKKNFLLQK